MKIITSHPIIKITDGNAEKVSNARGGGGGRRGGGGGRPFGGGRHFGGGHRRGGRRYFRGVAPVFVSGYAWNGSYWVDPNGTCYTKNWLGQYIVADCNAMSSVEYGV